jgi:PAS domain S-box-containing protein
MNESPLHDDLPEPVVKLLDRLERLTGRVPMGRAVSGILIVGLAATALVVAAVWWVEQYRAEQAFEATAGRLQALAQDRLDHKAAMVHQLADWAAYQSFDSNSSAAWSSGGVTLIGPEALKAGLLPHMAGLDDSQAAVVQRCLASLTRDHNSTLCQTSAQGGSTEAWFLAERVKSPGNGWVILPMDSADLAVTLDDGMYWRTQAHLLTPGTVAGAHGQVPVVTEAGAAGEQRVRQLIGRVRVAGHELPIALSGRARPHTWVDNWTHHTAMWLAGGAGVLFTLGGLHVYMMLISTRRRAGNLAKEMSTALQYTQSRNQAVMDTAPDAIIMTDGQGLVQWCNQATTSIFGRTLQDLVGRSISTILPALGEGSIDDWFATHGFSNRVIGFETMGSRNEGTAFPLAMSASRVELHGELIQTFIMRDTTDAKWAEQELGLRERALASSADAVVIVSMTLPNQPVIYVNQAFERITGYEAHEMLGLNCKLLQGADTNQPAVDTMRRAIAEGLSCHVVVRNYRKDGAMFYNDVAISPVLSPDGMVTHYVGVQNDITDRIAAEQVLKLRTERLNAVFELSPDGFVVLDKRGEVSIINPAFERMTGLQAAHLVGHSQDAFEEALMARCKASEIDEDSVAAVIAGPAAEGEQGQVASRELLHLHTPVARTLVRRVRRGGHDNEIVMYFRDITRELEVDRMKSEFLAMAAHELRTPMVSIFGFTELLLKRSFSDERRHDMLGTIHKQASILINLVNELLDLARIEARRGKDFKRRLQPIGPVIEQALDGLKVPTGRSQVKLHMEAADTEISADTDKLGQAVLNVLSNAYKYSPDGGDVILRVLQEAADGEARASQLVIEVQDHGMGMSPEHLARVFERFFRADPSGNIPGTGLGMTLVKEILSLHQGEVQVFSELGQGTRVRMTLPVPSQVPVAPESRGVMLETQVSSD